MAEQLEAIACFTKIREAAKGIGATVVPSPLLVRKSEMVPSAILDCDGFVAAVVGIRPRAIYLAEEEFEAKEAVHAELMSELGGGSDDDDDDEEGEDGGLLDLPSVRQLIRRRQKHDNSISSYTARFMVDGVLHFWGQTEDWYQTFDGELNLLVEELSASEEVRLRHNDAATRAVIVERAKVLAEHPLFKAPKATKAKRAYLASQLFPDSEDLDINRIVEEADNISWYQAHVPG